MKFSHLLGLGTALLALQLGSASAQDRTSASASAGSIQKADFFKVGYAPVRNAKTDDITVIYFFDYRCPTCRKYHADVSRALREESKVRVIYRDTPMLGDSSDAAAYAAIASKLQGRHEAMHDALMSAKGSLDEAGLRAAAQKANIDWDRLQRDIKLHKAEMDQLIARNFELAMEAGVYGTPAFIIGDSLANGALDYAGLKGEISDARKSLGPQTKTKPAAGAQLPPAEKPSASGAAAAGPRSLAVQSAPIFKRSAAETGSPTVTAETDRHGLSVLGLLAAVAGLIAAAVAALTWRQRSRRREAGLR